MDRPCAPHDVIDVRLGRCILSRALLNTACARNTCPGGNVRDKYDNRKRPPSGISFVHCQSRACCASAVVPLKGKHTCLQPPVGINNSAEHEGILIILPVKFLDFRTKHKQISVSEYLRKSSGLDPDLANPSHSFSTKGAVDRLCGYASSAPCTRSSRSKTRSPPTGRTLS